MRVRVRGREIYERESFGSNQDIRLFSSIWCRLFPVNWVSPMWELHQSKTLIEIFTDTGQGMLGVGTLPRSCIFSIPSLLYHLKTFIASIARCCLYYPILPPPLSPGNTLKSSHIYQSQLQLQPQIHAHKARNTNRSCVCQTLIFS